MIPAMRTMFASLISLSCAAMLTGCATSSNTPSKFDISAYRTFEIAPLVRQDGGKVRPEIEAAVVQTVESELAARGLSRVHGDAAELVVVVRGGIKPKVDPRYAGFTARTGVPVVSGTSLDIDQQNTGMLEVFLFDAKTKQILWRGYKVQDDIRQRPPPELVSMVVREVLADITRGQ